MKDKLKKLSTEIDNTIEYLNLLEELDKVIVTTGDIFYTNCQYCAFEEGKNCNNAKSKYYEKEIEYDFLCKEFYSYLVLEGKEEAVLEDFNKFEVLEL